MPLTIWNCVLSHKWKNYFSEKSACSAKKLFITEFPGSIFLLPTFLKGIRCEFQGANLLLATVNFEPCSVISCTIFIRL